MLDPNSAIPAFRRKPACDEADATGHVAGTLYVAPDGDVLMLHRSGAEENFKHHWALPGGGVDEGETPSQGARREALEEMGYEGPEPKKLLDRTRTPNGKVFHTFVQPVKEKFAPKLNGEHVGFTWAPIDKLPTPLHPAVQRTLEERIGKAQDMTPEDWSGLREGFLKWTAEEEAEPEHLTATDSALRLAMDEASVRTKSVDGHLHVKKTPIAKACVSPYRGEEIPAWRELGLDPGKVYQLLRDPEELERAAPTFNAKPFVRQHKPSLAETHSKDVAPLTIGSTGTETTFEDPYLYNSLAVWSAEDIADIESKAKVELSPGYRYRADMTPGIFRGTRYDGVMRDIGGNHVALVEDGRQGADVFVMDSSENLMATKPTRIAAFALQMTAAAVAPLMAMDAKVELPKDLFCGLTTKTIKTDMEKLKAGVRSAIDGKLRKGLALDASMADVGKVMDNVAELFAGEKGADESVSEEQHNAMEAAAHGNSNLGIPKSVGEEYVSKDAEPLANFLREKGMDEDSIKKACDMFPKNGLKAGDEAETDEDKKKREAEEAAKKAKDEADKDEKNKQAMDSAIKTAVGDAEARWKKNAQEVREAVHFVTPWTGTLSPTLALDSAIDVYHAAGKLLKIADVEKVKDQIALRAMIGAQPKPGMKPPVVRTTVMALDEATKKVTEQFGLDRIKVG